MELKEFQQLNMIQIEMLELHLITIDGENVIYFTQKI
jgi:hypothetical protein